MSKVLDFGFELQSPYYIHVCSNIIGKNINAPPQLLGYSYCRYSSVRKSLILKNSLSLICHESKVNQSLTIIRMHVYFFSNIGKRSHCGVMVKGLDCEIVVCEFEIQLRYYLHFQTNTLGKDMSSLILSAMG